MQHRSDFRLKEALLTVGIKDKANRRGLRKRLFENGVRIVQFALDQASFLGLFDTLPSLLPKGRVGGPVGMHGFPS